MFMQKWLQEAELQLQESKAVLYWTLHVHAATPPQMEEIFV